MKVVLGYRGAPPPDENQRRLDAGLERRLGQVKGQLVVVLEGEGLAVTDVQVSATQAAEGPGRVDARGAVYGALVEAGFAVLPLRPPHGPQVSWVDAGGATCDPPGDAPEWVETIGTRVGRSMQVVMQRADGGPWTCIRAAPPGEVTGADIEGFCQDVQEALRKNGAAVRL